MIVSFRKWISQAEIAQPVEHFTRNEGVVSSNLIFGLFFRRGCRTNVRQLILYIQHKTPSFEKPGVRGIISLCD